LIPPKAILAEHAAVASEQPLASLAGYDVLKAGGNAFDAAVATSYALAVTFHPAGGLGGDFFGMFYDAKAGKVLCLNSSGWAPSCYDSELLSESGGRAPRFGPLSCVVPGLVAGVSAMHEKLGTVDFGTLLKPAQTYATRGFPAGYGLARSVAAAYRELPPESLPIFAPSGPPPVPGETVRQESLARVIGTIAEEGPAGFYQGWPAEMISDHMQSLGVPWSETDFTAFRPEWAPPLSMSYRGTTVYETPPNSMGATSLLILKLLSEIDLSEHGPLSKDRVLRTTEAALTAYARRDEMLGDPRFSKVDIDAFLSPPERIGAPPERISPGDTTAFSIVDSKGNMVSGIQSLFNHFGSRVFVPGCGLFLNNRASGFGKTGPNRPEPRKRPLHTLSSLILERGGEPYLAIGTSGGDHRPMQHALFVTNSVDYSMAADANVEHPRFLWAGGSQLLVERGYELTEDGRYDIELLPTFGRTGVCQAVEASEGHLMAVCDPRGDGIPAGF
jgi:gamma-glutamyltranspeptidase / glutathione hydrolase